VLLDSEDSGTSTIEYASLDDADIDETWSEEDENKENELPIADTDSKQQLRPGSV